MSDTVEERLVSLLEDPKTDPYGNPIPGSGESLPGESLELSVKTREGEALRLLRIGEPIQADKGMIADFAAFEVKPGTQIEAVAEGNFVRLRSLEEGADTKGGICQGRSSCSYKKGCGRAGDRRPHGRK